MNKSSFFSAALVFAAFSGSAGAVVSLTADGRFVSGQSDALYNPGGFNAVSDTKTFTDIAQSSVGNFNPFNASELRSSLVNDPGQASASANSGATQVSTITIGPVFSVFDFEGTSTGDSMAATPNPSYTAQASHFNESLFDINFTISTPALFTLNGTVDALRSSAGFTAGASVVLTQIGNPTPIASFAVNNPSPGIIAQQIVINNGTGTLVAGSYKIRASAATTSSSVDTSMSGNAAYDLTLELENIPEPTTAALFMCGLVVVAGRRRRG